MAVNDNLRNSILVHAHYLDRYADGKLSEVVKVLRGALRDIEYRIKTEDNVITLSWLNDTKAWIEQEIGLFTTGMDSICRQMIDEVLSIEPELFGNELKKHVKINFEYNIPDAAILKRAVFEMPVDAGHLFEDLMKRYDQMTKDYVISEIRAGIVSGENTGELITRLSGPTSVLSIATASAERMVKSVVMHAMNTARLELYKSNSDLVKKVQYVATLDPRTCPVCGSLDGKTWALDEQHPSPPMHYNCRCVLAPITKGWKELGIDKEDAPETVRSSLNGNVPEGMDYKEWLAKQSEKVQKEILGTTRYKMYKNGMQIERMVRNNRILSIEEIRQKELFDKDT